MGVAAVTVTASLAVVDAPVTVAVGALAVAEARATTSAGGTVLMANGAANDSNKKESDENAPIENNSAKADATRFSIPISNQDLINQVNSLSTGRYKIVDGKIVPK